jgi:hypothetical protein
MERNKKKDNLCIIKQKGRKKRMCEIRKDGKFGVNKWKNEFGVKMQKK